MQVEELRTSLLPLLLPRDAAVDDDAGVVLEVRASVGGDWVAGFVADLVSMYRTYAAHMGWSFQVLVCCG
jgi:peptide chain release factor 1